MSERKPISKGRRFDIFKRDSFTCRYCGRRPPEVVLELDHVHPVSKGGTDDEINLATSCYDCNRGKKAKLPTDALPKLDADLAFLAIQQENVELQRFLKTKKKNEAIRDRVIASLAESWSSHFDQEYAPKDRYFLQWLRRYTPEDILSAIKTTGDRYTLGVLRADMLGLIKYTSTVLKNIVEDRDSETCDKYWAGKGKKLVNSVRQFWEE